MYDSTEEIEPYLAVGFKRVFYFDPHAKTFLTIPLLTKVESFFMHDVTKENGQNLLNGWIRGGVGYIFVDHHGKVF